MPPSLSRASTPNRYRLTPTAEDAIIIGLQLGRVIGWAMNERIHHNASRFAGVVRRATDDYLEWTIARG